MMNKKINFSTIITYFCCAVAAVIVCFTMYNLLNFSTDDQEKKANSFFGYYFFVVLSGSMEEELPVGSLVISKEVDVETIQEGDIISFISIDPEYIDQVVSHKVRGITEYEGELAFVTYGTTTGVSDNYPAISSKVLGVYQYNIPEVGKAIVFVQSENGFLLLIIIPLAILFIFLVIRLIIRLKKAQNEEIEEDLEEIPENTTAEEPQKTEIGHNRYRK